MGLRYEKIRHRAKLGIRNCLYSINRSDENDIIELCRMKGYKVNTQTIVGDLTTLEISW